MSLLVFITLFIVIFFSNFFIFRQAYFAKQSCFYLSLCCRVWLLNTLTPALWAMRWMLKTFLCFNTESFCVIFRQPYFSQDLEFCAFLCKLNQKVLDSSLTCIYNVYHAWTNVLTILQSVSSFPSKLPSLK